MLVIVDFGMGNLRSIQHKLEKNRVKAEISSDPKIIEIAKKIILPGVGHFKTGMKNLAELGIIDVLTKKALLEKTPILGICLGMQLLTKKSEEGNVKGLGWIDAETKKFHFPNCSKKIRIPHVGWNTINLKNPSILLNNINPAERFYFTHSYYVTCSNHENIIATTHYGTDFVSVLQKENICGTQFHPEKSHKNGFEIIKNFIRI